METNDDTAVWTLTCSCLHIWNCVREYMCTQRRTNVHTTKYSTDTNSGESQQCFKWISHWTHTVCHNSAWLTAFSWIFSSDKIIQPAENSHFQTLSIAKCRSPITSTLLLQRQRQLWALWSVFATISRTLLHSNRFSLLLFNRTLNIAALCGNLSTMFIRRSWRAYLSNSLCMPEENIHRKQIIIA